MINVEKIEPTGLFTNYIYKAIPLAFDESMSYYETLCGLLSYLKDTVIPTLNNNADAIIEVQDKIIELQDYVDNYFENLDVQTEINNKLDEMTEDGSLTAIIKNYVDPLCEQYQQQFNAQISAQNTLIDNQNTTIQNQNNNIGNLTSQISTLSERVSGFESLTEGSTTGDAELIDGRTSFDSVVYDNIGDNIRISDDKINKRLTKYINVNLLENAIFESGFFNNVGDIVSSDNYYSTPNHIVVSPNTKYYFNKVRKVLWYQNKTTGNTFLRADDVTNANANNLEITSPANVNYCRLSIYTTDYNNNNYTMNEIKENFTDFGKNKIKTSIANRTNMFYGRTASDGFLRQNSVNASDSYKYYGDYIPVKANHTYRISPRVRFCCYYTTDFTAQYDSDFDLNSSASAGPQTITPTSDGYIRPTVYASDYTDGLCKMEDITTDTKTYPVNALLLNDDFIPNGNALNYIKSSIDLNIKDKVLYNFGDSIGAGDGNSGIGYAEMLESIYGTHSTDYAQGGATLSKIENQEMHSVLDQIDNASNTPPDIILLEGGPNDYTQYRVTGDMTNEFEFNHSNFDITTYCGALEECFYKLITKYPGVPIVWIYTHRENTRTEKTNGEVTVNFTTMHDKSLEICKKWSIPVVDIYNKSGLNTMLDYYKNLYTYNQDGTHPNQAGYLKYYVPFIISKLSEIFK